MITIDLPMEEALLLLGLKSEDNLIELFHRRQTVKLDGLDVALVSYSDYVTASGIIRGGRYRNLHMFKADLEPVRLITPKEQLDAEEAVEKAKASLEAAQKVLESVKGKNN